MTFYCILDKFAFLKAALCKNCLISHYDILTMHYFIVIEIEKTSCEIYNLVQYDAIDLNCYQFNGVTHLFHSVSLSPVPGKVVFVLQR